MPELVDLYIAKNIYDLERVALSELAEVKNPEILEKLLKKLYKQIFNEISDQEKCFIYSLRYVHLFGKLCKTGDSKFYNLIYSREISRVNTKIEELKPDLEQRYKELVHKEKFKVSIKKVPPKVPIATENEKQPLFPNEFLSVKELYQAIESNMDILLVDLRPSKEYEESKIQFERCINIPEDIIVAGLSANIIGSKLNNDKKLWDKRDSFTAIVILDWNSGSDNVLSMKINYIKASIVDWDCLRHYKQHPVILNGGFKEFLDSYPGYVTNAHVNFIRRNEDIDELLELDSISYPEPDQNVSLMPLKQFTIKELEEFDKNDEELLENIDRMANKLPQEVSNDIPEESPILPKGGGTFIDKISIKQNFESMNDINCGIDDLDIKNKYQEEYNKLLKEARNNKPKPACITDRNYVIEEFVGDRTEVQNRIIPPVIRRDKKPQKRQFIINGWCGLVNIKNTCYMNTILQCLKCIPVISALLHSNPERFINRRPAQIMNEFSSVIKTLCEGTEIDKKVFRPLSFYEAICKLDPIYKKGKHEDCMEFFLFLFNHLSDDCSQDIKKKSNVMTEREKAWYSHLQGRTSLWVDLFYHQFKSTKICLVCNSKDDSYETDNTLMLPVPYRPSSRIVHMRDLINDYLEDNQILDYKCSKCHHMRVINKKTIVLEPEILVIVLKRYYQDEYQETRKNNVYVNFDINFKFGNYSYRLFSVAQHKGTMEYGHYYCHGALNESLWVEFNDERTTKFTGDWDSIRGSACAFFYCKNN